MAFPDGTADFRSDTVSRPTAAMRQAMAVAEVGDEVYGEDPTVKALEETAAALLGKEAAVFVPSGTMANQIAIGAQTHPGEEVVCVETAHVRNYEHGGASANFGVGFRTVASPNGEMTSDAIEAATAGSVYHLPEPTLLTWENTHNVSGGTIVPLEVMQQGSAVARSRGLAVHLDGARLWNAVAASGVDAADYAACADTVMFCFSKGLGAPIGSVLTGPAAVIARAGELRFRLGGGMRQAGIIAAAAAVALANRERLVADHELAGELARGLADRLPLAVDPTAVKTNMLLVAETGLPWPATRLVAALAAAGIAVGFIRPGILRFCTHHDVDHEDVAAVLRVVDGLR
jgi:threonine aldolase